MNSPLQNTAPVLEPIEDLPVGISIIVKRYFLQAKKHKEIAKELARTPMRYACKKQGLLSC
jgi:hypothetical protein